MIHTAALPVICRELIKVVANQSADSIERLNAALLLAGFTLNTDMDTNFKIQGDLSQLFEHAEPFKYVMDIIDYSLSFHPPYPYFPASG